MNRRTLLGLAVAGALTVAGAAGAAVHHGWSNYDSKKPLNLVGTVERVEYANPHVMIDLRTAGQGGKRWEAVLAPPSRMRSRGLPEEGLRAGMTARVVGYPHLKNAGEMRAERIIIANDTTELR